MRAKGMTLVELLITVGLIVVALSVAVPSFQYAVETEQLKAVSEGLAANAQFARSEAIKKHAGVWLAFQGGTNWCYGLHDEATCDCNTPGSCTINWVEKVVRASSFPTVGFAMTGFATGDTRFEGTRGTASPSGAIIFTRNNKSIQVEVNAMGRIKVCSSTVLGYDPC